MKSVVDEGKTSYHAYSLLKKDGVTPVESVEALKYKVSDGTSDLVGWINLPLEATGEIEVPGPINRITAGNQKRYLTLFAVHDGGDHLPQELEYVIRAQKGITPETDPKE